MNKAVLPIGIGAMLLVGATTYAVPIVVSSKGDQLQLDANGDGLAQVGDVLLYRITVENSGDMDATSVVFSDFLDPNTSLIVGTVTTTQGVVVVGNSVGDSSVAVNIGVLSFGALAQLMFQAQIISFAPAVSNQGVLTGDNFADVLTDDPDAAGNADPTVTIVTREDTVPEPATVLLLGLGLIGLGTKSRLRP